MGADFLRDFLRGGGCARGRGAAGRAIAQLSEAVGGQRDAAGMRRAVRFVGVIVRSARDGEPEAMRDRTISSGRRLVVIGVIRLDARRDRPRRVRSIHSSRREQAGMGQRRDAARVVNLLDDGVRRRAFARHERRDVRATARWRTRRSSSRRSRRRPARARSPGGRSSGWGRSIAGRMMASASSCSPNFCEPDDHPADAIDAALPLLGEEDAQRRRLRIDEIAEDVHVDFFAHRRDLDAGDERRCRRRAQAAPPRRRRRRCRGR